VTDKSKKDGNKLNKVFLKKEHNLSPLLFSVIGLKSFIAERLFISDTLCCRLDTVTGMPLIGKLSVGSASNFLFVFKIFFALVEKFFFSLQKTS
jgi:hypothetical protein